MTLTVLPATPGKGSPIPLPPLVTATSSLPSPLKSASVVNQTLVLLVSSAVGVPSAALQATRARSADCAWSPPMSTSGPSGMLSRSQAAPKPRVRKTSAVVVALRMCNLLPVYGRTGAFDQHEDESLLFRE